MSDQITAQNLNELMTQLKISGAQLARQLKHDATLISKWRKNGFGKCHASQHALDVGKYVAGKHLSPENQSWLSARLRTAGVSGAITPESVALYLYPEADIPRVTPEGPFASMEVVDSVRAIFVKPPATAAPSTRRADALYDVRAGLGEIASVVYEELSNVADGSEVDIFLSSESVSSAVDKGLLDSLIVLSRAKQLTLNVLVQSANNSAMLSRLVGAYIPLLVDGRLRLSLVQGTPQTFSASMNILAPDRAAIIVTEAVQKKSAAIATIVRDADMLSDMRENFVTTSQYSRPLMTAYDDNFGRNIIEAFFEEYGMPGSLDVIKSGLNPMFITPVQYNGIVAKFGYDKEQYEWRCREFFRFKEAMDGVLQSSRFREVLSLTKLNEIAETGRCRMPAMYFMNAGIWYLDAADCLHVLDGYIRYLEQLPTFEVVLLEDERLFMENSCWHIKNNKHVIIHSWNTERPIMVYSDQLLLIDEFQKHFDHLWSSIDAGSISKRNTILTLREYRARIAAKAAHE